MIDAVKKAIHGRYGMTRKRFGFVLDQDTKNITIYINPKESFGFCLDNEDNPPFHFFRASPPKHLSKMCDAIVIFERGQALYFTLIEQKTGDPAEYDKQLANGKFFCEWLVALCQEHDYCASKTISYLGVLVWEPRPIPLKGTTTHPLPEACPHRLFDKVFDIQNQTTIDIEQLVSIPAPVPAADIVPPWARDGFG